MPAPDGSDAPPDVVKKKNEKLWLNRMAYRTARRGWGQGPVNFQHPVTQVTRNDPMDAAPAPLLACPIMAELVAKHRPPVFQPVRPFPSLVDAIISQQISGKAAESILARLKTLVPITQSALAGADLRRLRRAGLSRAKAVYVRELARFAAAGGLRGIHRLPDQAVVERLTGVKGVGVWTAEMFLIFSLGRPDVWPVGDGGVQRAAFNLYGVRNLKKLAQLGDRFRPYRTHAAWYLWRSLS